MKKLILLAFILVSTKILAQTHTETIAGCAGNFMVTAETQPDKSYKITVTDAGDPSKSIVYPIKTTDLDVFASALSQKIISLTPAGSPPCTEAQTDALTVAGKKFYFGLIASNTNDDPNAIPLAGTLKIKEQLYIYAKPVNSSSFAKSAVQYKVQQVQIEIKSGFIENIRAYILIDGTVKYFNNFYGIGFTSVTNFKNLSGIELYETNSSPYTGKSKPSFYIKLSELLDYDYDLELDRRDYSPADIKTTIKGGDTQKLYKLATSKLFEAKIFTDFIGLSENKPNGLVQTEISKDINLNTIQHQSPLLMYPFFKSFGFFQFITPVVNISKIEQHNRNLILNDLDSLRLRPGKNDTLLLNASKHRFTTALDLYRYQSYSFGFDLNILNLTNHDLKYSLNFNLGARLGITSVTDSLTKIADNKITKTGFVSNFTVKTLQLLPSATITFLPEERFNFSISDAMMMVKPVDNNFELLSFDRATNQKITYPVKSWLNTVELQMAIQVNANSKLFARGRFTSELHNINNNFSQIQVGYSTYILGNK